MTTRLVAINAVSTLSLLKGDVVTDDPAATGRRVFVKSSAYVLGLLSGNLRSSFVAVDPTTGRPVVPTALDLIVASVGQMLIQSAPSIGLTAPQLYGLLAAYLASHGYPVAPPDGGGGDPNPPPTPAQLHSTFAAFGLLGASTS